MKNLYWSSNEHLWYYEYTRNIAVCCFPKTCDLSLHKEFRSIVLLKKRIVEIILPNMSIPGYLINMCYTNLNIGI